MCSFTVSVGGDAEYVTGDKMSKFRYSDKTCCKSYVRLFLCVFPGGRDTENVTGNKMSKYRYLGGKNCYIRVMSSKGYVRVSLCVLPDGRDAENVTGDDEQVPLLGKKKLLQSYVIQELSQNGSVCSSRWKRC